MWCLLVTKHQHFRMLISSLNSRHVVIINESCPMMYNLRRTGGKFLLYKLCSNILEKAQEKKSIGNGSSWITRGSGDNAVRRGEARRVRYPAALKEWSSISSMDGARPERGTLYRSNNMMLALYNNIQYTEHFVNQSRNEGDNAVVLRLTIRLGEIPTPYCVVKGYSVHCVMQANGQCMSDMSESVKEIYDETEHFLIPLFQTNYYHRYIHYLLPPLCKSKQHSK